jgi:mono/diheme cytochrome c family protein
MGTTEFSRWWWKNPVAISTTRPEAGIKKKVCRMFVRLNWIGYPAMVVAALAATSSFAADPDHGETLVKRWCAACHLVASDQKSATTEAPSFLSVAKRPGFDAAKIAFFLLDPHPKMPNMELSRDEAADIAAYIATLK